MVNTTHEKPQLSDFTWYLDMNEINKSIFLKA